LDYTARGTQAIFFDRQTVIKVRILTLSSAYTSSKRTAVSWRPIGMS